MKVVYIAGKFRAPDAFGIAENIRAAERLALDVWRIGAVALCPHLNTANFQGALPDQVWLDGDLDLLARCDAVLMVPGWLESDGARTEHSHAQGRRIPVFYDVPSLRQWLTMQPSLVRDVSGGVYASQD